MNNIIKKTDYRPVLFGSVVDELFQTNFNRLFDERAWGSGGLNTESRVPVNVAETDTAYEITVFAPGLKKEDFQLNVTADTLTVSCECREEKSADKSKNWIHREYRAHSFSRIFNIDGSVDVDRTNARYENGVLLLMLPKKAGSSNLARKIDVQ